MPKNQFPKNKSTSCYLSSTAAEYLANLCLILRENKSQIINRLIIEEHARILLKHQALHTPESANEENPDFPF